MRKINLWNTIPPCFQNRHFSTNWGKIRKISYLISFSVIFIGFIGFLVSFRVKIHQPNISPYLPPWNPRQISKRPTNWPKFLINDVRTEVLIIFRSWNPFFGFSDLFYIRIGPTSISIDWILFDLSQFRWSGRTCKHGPFWKFSANDVTPL